MYHSTPGLRVIKKKKICARNRADCFARDPGLVLKAHRLLYHSTLGSIVIKKEKNRCAHETVTTGLLETLRTPPRPSFPQHFLIRHICMQRTASTLACQSVAWFPHPRLFAMQTDTMCARETVPDPSCRDPSWRLFVATLGVVGDSSCGDRSR